MGRPVLGRPSLPSQNASFTKKTSLSSYSSPVVEAPTNDELMHRTSQGDREAFATLVERHHGEAWRVAMRFSGDQEEARDILQTSFLKIFQGASEYRGEGRFEAYLRTVVARTCLDETKRRKPTLMADPGAMRASPGPQPPELVETRDRAHQVQRRVLELPGNQRLAVLLHYFRNLRYREIGEVLGIGERAVEGLLRRARGALLGRLEDPGEKV
jgi:RNA polymerase sigma-70 factor (ECF subfamily)